MTAGDGILQHPSSSPVLCSVTGNGSAISISYCSHVPLATPTSSQFTSTMFFMSLRLFFSLLSVCQFTRENSSCMEVDPFGFSVKDLRMRAVIYQCYSGGDFYTLASSPSTAAAFISAAKLSDVWHRWLGHPGRDASKTLQKSYGIPLIFQDG